MMDIIEYQKRLKKRQNDIENCEHVWSSYHPYRCLLCGYDVGLEINGRHNRRRREQTES